MNGRIEREFPLPDISQCASPSFSPDGKRVAFEGNRGGIVDIFELDLASGEIRNLTQDDFFDANPWYASDGKSLLYNRRIGTAWKVFSVDREDPARSPSSVRPLERYSAFVLPGRKDGLLFLQPEHLWRVQHHALDLASGDVRQYTDVVGGCFNPVEMAPRKEEPYLVFTSFFEGTFRLYRMPLRQPEALVSAAEASTAVVDVEPFEPPMQLKSDPSKIAPYKLRWDIEAPSISVGVTDDGTFLANIGLQFTDLLGDHRVSVLAYSVADYANIDVAYVNLKQRLRWGAEVFDFRNYYLSAGGYGLSRQQAYRATGATFFAHYPFNRYYRGEIATGRRCCASASSSTCGPSTATANSRCACRRRAASARAVVTRDRSSRPWRARR